MEEKERKREDDNLQKKAAAQWMRKGKKWAFSSHFLRDEKKGAEERRKLFIFSNFPLFRFLHFIHRLCRHRERKVVVFGTKNKLTSNFSFPKVFERKEKLITLSSSKPSFSFNNKKNEKNATINFLKSLNFNLLPCSASSLYTAQPRSSSCEKKAYHMFRNLDPPREIKFSSMFSSLQSENYCERRHDDRFKAFFLRSYPPSPSKLIEIFLHPRFVYNSRLSLEFFPSFVHTTRRRRRQSFSLLFFPFFSCLFIMGPRIWIFIGRTVSIWLKWKIVSVFVELIMNVGGIRKSFKQSLDQQTKVSFSHIIEAKKKIESSFLIERREMNYFMSFVSSSCPQSIYCWGIRYIFIPFGWT